MKKWYNVINEKGADKASVLIYDIIGGGFFEDGTNAKDFANTLLALEKDYKNIDIRINSPGGSVFEGLGIVNAILNSKSNIETYIDGIAYSMAAIIALSGKKVHIAKNGRLMLHNASLRAQGNAQDLRNEANNLEGYDSSLAMTVSAITGLTDAEVKAKFFNFKDNYFSSTEALQNKLVHEVIPINAEGVDNLVKLQDYQDVLAHYKTLDPAAFKMPETQNISNQNNKQMKFTALAALTAILEAKNTPAVADIAKAQVELTAENTGIVILDAEVHNTLVTAQTELAAATASVEVLTNVKALFPNAAEANFDLLTEIKNLQTEITALKSADGDRADRGEGGDQNDTKNKVTVTEQEDIDRMLKNAGLK